MVLIVINGLANSSGTGLYLSYNSQNISVINVSIINNTYYILDAYPSGFNCNKWSLNNVTTENEKAVLYINDTVTLSGWNNNVSEQSKIRAEIALAFASHCVSG